MTDSRKNYTKRRRYGYRRRRSAAGYLGRIAALALFVLLAFRYKDADRILVLGKNGIEEEGTHEELLSKKGTYYRLWNGAYEEE